MTESIDIELIRSAAPEPSSTDGRRRRGQDNRARIVAAMLELIHAGDMSPSAEQVAARADVGLRTVFRHFNDMDSLYREISEAIEVEVQAVVGQPFRAEDWRSRVLELIERRARVFERIGPFMHAADAFRHKSRFLAADGARLANALREILKRELPAEVARDLGRLEALDLLMSFEAWDRLRRVQGLSPPRAQEVVEATVRRLIEAPF